MISALFRSGTVVLALLTAPAFAAADNPVFKLGKTTYKQFCSHCHGPSMVNPGTSSYDLRRWPKDQKAGFFESVKNGKGDMPSWGDVLLEKELEALWLFVATRAGKEPLAAQAPGNQKKN